MGDICINSPDMTTVPIVLGLAIYRLLLRCLATHNKSTCVVVFLRATDVP